MKKYEYRFIKLFSNTSTFEYGCDRHRLRLDFLDEGLVRFALYTENQRLLPTWSVCPDDRVMAVHGRERLSVEGFPMDAPEVVPGGGVDEFHTGSYRLKLDFHNLFLAFYKGDDLLFSDRPYCAYNLNGELGEGAKHFMTAEENEHIYGLGEKSGNVDRYGRSFVLGARDPMGYDARSTDPLYKHIPFYICENSVGSYGIFYDTHASGVFNFSREIDNYYGRFKSFSCEDDALVYYVFLGDIPHISQRFARICGRCALPPKWTLDYCGSTMAYTEAENANDRLMGFLDACERHKIQCSGFYLSSGYSSRNGKRYVFTWNHDKIPQPKRLCDTFQDKGVNLIANIKPAFLTDHPMYEMLAEKGYFLHYADGSPAVMPFWDGFGSYLDFTNPGAFHFWSEMVREQLIDVGVTSTWNDNNEYYIADRDVYAFGFGQEIPAYRICQVFPMLMVMASHKAQTEAGQFRPMLSTRSGGAGLQRLAQTWTGDNRTAFSDLRYNHKMAMGMSLSGIYVFGHDLGGFAGPRPNEELFLRWLQYGALMPRFCIHSWNQDGTATEPWTYPERLKEVQNIFAFRKRLKPFLNDLLWKAHRDFLPVMAPVFYYHPKFDPESDQFMLGNGVMACCVFDEGVKTVNVTLPEIPGGWYYGKYACDVGTYEFPCTYNDLPVLLHRSGSVFAEDTSDYYAKESPRLRFTVYPLPMGSFDTTFFDDNMTIHFQVQCQKDTVCVKTDSASPLNLRLVDRYNRKLEIL